MTSAELRWHSHPRRRDLAFADAHDELATGRELLERRPEIRTLFVGSCQRGDQAGFACAAERLNDDMQSEFEW